jgi:hypothetical protein
MSTASISGTFDIVLRPAAATTAWTIANLGSGGFAPGRAFRIQQVLVTGTGNAGYTITTRKNSASGATCAVYTGAGGGFFDAPSVITEANTVFSATDNIYISAAGGGGLAATDKVIIRCIAADAQALTVT